MYLIVVITSYRRTSKNERKRKRKSDLALLQQLSAL
jgi:uncharacterized protein YciI